MIEKLSYIAKKAGEITLKHFRNNTEVFHKSDGSPVTIADREAEKYIIEELQKQWSTPAFGEESCGKTENLAFLNEYWLIDPLDGTREYVDGNDEYTVNIALIRRGRPVTGVIYAPAKDLLYYGSESGAYKISAEGKQKLPVETSHEFLNVAVSKRHPAGEQENNFLSELQSKYTVNIVKVGSSLKFCMVAEGSASIYFRAGRTMYWDSAAGQAIVEAAGGKVLNWDKLKPLTYAENKKLENPSFFAISKELLSLVALNK